MSEVKRFYLDATAGRRPEMVEDRDGLYCEFNAAQSELAALRLQCGGMESEIDALREELARKDRVIEDLLGSNGDMTTCLKSAEHHEPHCLLLDPEEPDCNCTCIAGRLTVAEQRNDESLNKVTELNGLLLFLRQRYAIRLDSTDLEAIDAALKPTESENL